MENALKEEALRLQAQERLAKLAVERQNSLTRREAERKKLLAKREAERAEREKESKLRTVKQKQEAMRKKITELNAEASKCYLNGKSILQFSKDSYKEVKAVRLASDIGSKGTLGMRRAQTLIKKCEQSAKMYAKAGAAFTYLAKMLHKTYKAKTYELNESEKLKFDSIVGQLETYLESIKEVESEGKEVRGLISAAFSTLERKAELKAAQLRWRQRSRSYYHRYGSSYYSRYHYYYDGYHYYY